MGKRIWYIFLFFPALHVAAQDRIEADRPGESRSSELVKGNHLQVELGFRKEKISDEQDLYQHPSITARYGLFNAIELRMEAASQSIRNRLNKEGRDGLLPLEFGLKGKILPEYKWYPSIALLGMIGIPSTSSNDYFNRRLPVEFRALFGKTFHERWRIQYNTGLRWEGNNRQAQWMYSITPVYSLNDKMNLFVEQYAFLQKATSAEHYIDGGLEIFAGRNFMFDVSAGLGISSNASPYFLSAGLSYRLSVR